MTSAPRAPTAPAGSQIRVTVPMPPSLTNPLHGRSRHWRTVAREKRAYYARLDELQGAGLIPAPPPVAFRRPMLSSTMHVGAKNDHDNAVARHKWPIDWLATRGYIVNDRALDWHAFPTQIVKRGVDYRIDLLLIERAA